MPSRSKRSSAQHELVECDLEFPRILKELSKLELNELEQIEATIKKISQMTWDQIYKTSSRLALDVRDPGLSAILASQFLQPLHSDTRWQPLLRKIGIPEEYWPDR